MHRHHVAVKTMRCDSVFLLFGLGCMTIQLAGQESRRVADLLVKAEQGTATAQFNLGNIYANGDGVAIDRIEAMKWYRLEPTGSCFTVYLRQLRRSSTSESLLLSG